MSCSSGEGAGDLLPAAAVPISRLLSMVREPIRAALVGSEFCVFGDVEKCREYRGSFYLTLVDKADRYTYMLRVFVPASVVRDCGCEIRENSKVLVTGHVGTTKLGNELQLSASRYEDIGVGKLVAQVEQWRTEYSHLLGRVKKPLPRLCFNVGVISNPETQGFVDFCSHLKFGRVVLLRRKMQGETVAEDVAAGLRSVGGGGLDCVGIVRGGGSFRDLFEFNKPVLLEAIASCGVPVVTAIGHESDMSLADQCADLSVGTPTAFGQLLSGRFEGELRRIGEVGDSLVRSFNGDISSRAASLSLWKSTFLGSWVGALEKAESECLKFVNGITDSFLADVDRGVAVIGSMGKSMLGSFIHLVDLRLHAVSSMKGMLEKMYQVEVEKDAMVRRHRKTVFLGVVVIAGLMVLLVAALLLGGRGR